MFLPQAGCPGRCIYCCQESATGTDPSFATESIRRIVSDYRCTRDDAIRTKPSSVVELAFYGGNFTGLPVETQSNLLEKASGYIESGDLSGIRLSTRPDDLDRDIVHRLKAAGVTTVEVGAQTMEPSLLSGILREHTPEDVINAVSLLKEAGLAVGVHLMIGLPGERPEHVKESAGQVAALAPDHVRIHPCLVLEGSPLADIWRAGKYRPLSLPQAVRRTAAMVTIFENHRIPVARLALHPPAGGWGDRLLAGPWHPAFSELVHSFIFRRRILAALTGHLEGKAFDGTNPVNNTSEESSRRQTGDTSVPVTEDLIIHVNPRDMSRAVGYKRVNARILKRLIGREPVYAADETVEPGQVTVL